uniref:Uncharacterized protein n=1 Tax=Rhizophora mucronata TaxID=61149 RepID=A0A2P2ISJ9_RHIMU
MFFICLDCIIPGKKNCT